MTYFAAAQITVFYTRQLRQTRQETSRSQQNLSKHLLGLQPWSTFHVWPLRGPPQKQQPPGGLAHNRGQVMFHPNISSV